MKSLIFILSALISVSALSAQIASKEGGKCFNVEGGIREGGRLIGYNCTGAANENFVFERERLKLMGTNLCAEATSRNSGAEIRMKKCNFTNSGTALQNFGQWADNQIGHNSGMVMDLEGGWVGGTWSSVSGTNQRVVLYTNNHQNNQKWQTGTWKTGQTFQSLPQGQVFTVPGYKGWLEKRGNNIVAAGGGNIVAAGGGNIVAAGGGNIVAAGAGN